jgi:hypothetical protein
LAVEKGNEGFASNRQLQVRLIIVGKDFLTQGKFNHTLGLMSCQTELLAQGIQIHRLCVQQFLGL